MKLKRILEEKDAKFIGWQKVTGGKSIPLYNIVKKGHPLENFTVTIDTLKRNKLTFDPPPPMKEAGNAMWIGGGEHGVEPDINPTIELKSSYKKNSSLPIVRKKLAEVSDFYKAPKATVDHCEKCYGEEHEGGTGELRQFIDKDGYKINLCQDCYAELKNKGELIVKKEGMDNRASGYFMEQIFKRLSKEGFEGVAPKTGLSGYVPTLDETNTPTDVEAIKYIKSILNTAKQRGKDPNPNVIRDLLANKFRIKFRDWPSALRWATDIMKNEYNPTKKFGGIV